jgi:enoyl-CoA hydratase/carnithine racemase
MDYEQILAEQRDDVLLLTLNRPERLNAWTPRMSAELAHAIEAADVARINANFIDPAFYGSDGKFMIEMDIRRQRDANL